MSALYGFLYVAATLIGAMAALVILGVTVPGGIVGLWLAFKGATRTCVGLVLHGAHAVALPAQEPDVWPYPEPSRCTCNLVPGPRVEVEAQFIEGHPVLRVVCGICWGLYPERPRMAIETLPVRGEAEKEALIRSLPGPSTADEWRALEADTAAGMESLIRQAKAARTSPDESQFLTEQYQAMQGNLRHIREGLAIAVKRESCTHEDVTEIHRYGSPTPVRTMCTACGATPVDDPDTGERLGAIIESGGDWHLI